MIRTPFCKKPASTARRLRRLLEKSSAPTTRTSDRATCDTTNIWRSPNCVRPEVTLRLLVRKASEGERRDARNPGAKPNRKQVRVVTPRVNASSRQAGLRSRNSGSPCVPSEATKNWLRICARASPSAPPMSARRKLSVISCRMRRLRGAPMASRTANSCSRAVARASIRFARFAHAINKTRNAVPNRSERASEY